MDDKKKEIQQFIENLDMHEKRLKSEFEKLAEDIKGPFINDPGEYVKTSSAFIYGKEYGDKLKLALEFELINSETYNQKSNTRYNCIMHVLSVVPQIAEVAALKNWVKKKIDESTSEQLEEYKQSLEEDLIFRERILSEKSKQEYKSIISAIKLHQQNSLQPKKAAMKLNWSGDIIQLADLFRSLMFADENKYKKAFIGPQNKENIKRFLSENFTCNGDLSIETLNDYFKKEDGKWKVPIKKENKIIN